MKIAIIGTGQIGGSLTRRFTALCHEVFIANSRGPNTLAELASETGAVAVSALDAARSGDVVIITIPEKNIPKLPPGLFDGVSGDIVIVDTGNYYPQQRDGWIGAIENGMPESRWVEQQIGRSVVKVFNNIQAKHLLELGRPAGSAGRIALPVAGNSAHAKSIILGLVDALGFDGVDAGRLDDSWRQQPGTPVYGTDLDAEGVQRALAQARPERAPEFSGLKHSPANH